MSVPCPVAGCRRSFLIYGKSQVSALAKHLRDVHRGKSITQADEDKLGLLKCPICADYFVIAGMSAHYRISHSGVIAPSHTSLSLPKVKAPVPDVKSPAPSADAKQECQICLELYSDQARLKPCQHVFHLPCIMQWLLTDSSCPQCRSVVNSCNDLPIESKKQPVASGYDELMDPWDAPDLSLPPVNESSAAPPQEAKARDEGAFIRCL